MTSFQCPDGVAVSRRECIRFGDKLILRRHRYCLVLATADVSARDSAPDSGNHRGVRTKNGSGFIRGAQKGYGGKLVVKDMLAAGLAATFAQVRQVVDQFCALCHNAQVQNKGVALLTLELLCQHAQAVY